MYKRDADFESTFAGGRTPRRNPTSNRSGHNSPRARRLRGTIRITYGIYAGGRQ